MTVSKNLARSIREYNYRDDIIAWIHDIQKIEPDDFQVQFLEAKDMEILLLWSRQTGKTDMAAFKACHKSRYEPGSLSLIASATQRQAGILQRRANFAMIRATDTIKHGGWQKVKDVENWEYDPYDPAGEGGRIVKQSILSLELMNESQIISVPASPETVRGYSPDLIIIDEAAWVRDAVYNAIRPMRAAKPVQLVSISSANATQGFYYEDWINKDINVLKIKMTADQCPRITEEFLKEERKRCVSEAIFLREYYCIFMKPEGTMFNQDMIDQLFMPREADEEIAKMDKSDKTMIAPGGLYGWR